jgi:hypothetical protein
VSHQCWAFFFFFETGTHYVVQVGLEFAILLSQPPVRLESDLGRSQGLVNEASEQREAEGGEGGLCHP